MVKIWFPGLYIPRIRITKGRFLKVWLLGVKIEVPPWDITILPKTTIWKGFPLFDTDWIINPIIEAMTGVAGAVWDLFESTLDAMANEWFKEHPEAEEWVKKRS